MKEIYNRILKKDYIDVNDYIWDKKCNQNLFGGVGKCLKKENTKEKKVLFVKKRVCFKFCVNSKNLKQKACEKKSVNIVI